MLKSLQIQNYAIIEQVSIQFSSNLNIITGETGAGKSIIMGAVGLILGERADASVLVRKDAKCIVEGNFTMPSSPAITSFLRNNDLDVNDELVIRREIGINGKSRAFINDTPVNLSQLTELSSMLVDMHQQFDTLELGDSGFQRQVIDALADHADGLENYRRQYQSWVDLKNELQKLEEQKQQFDKEAGYNQYQYNELEEASFTENEIENVDAELKILNHSEGIKSALSQVYHELQESETPLLQQLKRMQNQLGTVSAFHPDLSGITERLHSAQVELQDIADELDRISNHVQFDPARVERLNERLSTGYKLLKKHGVQTTAELLIIQAELSKKLEAVLGIDDLILANEKKLGEIHSILISQAKKISEARQKQVKPLEEKVNKLLVQVGMPGAKLKVDIRPAAELNSSGADEINFLFDANKSGQFLPVRKVASGGELSRLMLCIKSLVAQSINLPTMIFDEIDTGISGESARQVGVIMKGLAARRQIICITHQPQIAGKADAHYFVYKDTGSGAVTTNIRELSMEERIRAIAQMLGGEKPTTAAMENAREMVMN